MLLLLLVSLAFFSITKLGWTSLFSMLLNFGSLLDMSSNSMAWNYAPLLKNLVQSWVNPTLVLSFFPLLRKISLTWLVSSWGFLYLWPKDGAHLISWMYTWFSSIFLSRMFLWPGWRAFNISMLFVFVFLWGTSWCMRHLVLTQEFFDGKKSKGRKSNYHHLGWNS